MKSAIIVADSKGWFLKSASFKELGRWVVVTVRTEAELRESILKYNNAIATIFFVHWSWKVPREIFEAFSSIVFHTAPLPFGRGGSPIQNLIQRGFKESPIFALVMTEDLDGGPILARREVSLDGSLDEIFDRCQPLIEEMMVEITSTNPVPIEQIGEPVVFSRLTKEDNDLSKNIGDVSSLYNSIRMVDSDFYNPAFIRIGQLKYEFKNARLKGGYLEATVRISQIEN